MKYKFTKDITGSNNGFELEEYKKGQEIEKEDLCSTLFMAWEDNGTIVKVDEDGEENTPDTPAPEELTDEQIGELVYQAKEILEIPENAELSETDIAKLKEIGIQLKISGMMSSQKPQTILDKINAYIDEYEGVGEDAGEEEIPAPTPEVDTPLAPTPEADEEIEDMLIEHLNL